MKRRLVYGGILIGSLVVVLCVVVVRQWLAPTPPAPAASDTVINITFPYLANPDREHQIRQGFKRVQPGESVAQVRDTLGTPDEVRPLYELQIKNPQRIGTTYWYFLAKESEERTVNAKVIRISFDLNDRVTQIDHWGLDEANPADSGKAGSRPPK